MKYYSFAEGEVDKIKAIVSRTGYTGEDGFEIYLDAAKAARLWNTLLLTGRSKGMVPVGLGARDTLRLEAAMALYGHEISRQTHPLEAGLGWAVSFGKGDFLGRKALESAKSQGSSRRLVGLEVEKRIPRQGYPVISGGRPAGEITSGTQSPLTKKNIAMAYVEAGLGEPGAPLEVQIRSESVPAAVVQLPPGHLLQPVQHHLGAVAAVVPLLIEPKFQNVIALVASVGVALAFAFKDYASCLVAGLVTVAENTYQPGDWIEVDGTYGEVKSIGVRAVRLVTPDETEVSIPHQRLWSASIFNASSGNRSLLCVADFYLHPEHDASSVRQRLAEVATTSPYRKPETPVTVIILEKPWGTHYRLKAYVKESREQFLFLTDLTVRGKEMLRSMGVRFAQATYAEISRS